MINRVILVGRLTKNAEIRKTASGKSTTSFTLAVDKPNKKNITTGETADFIPCVAWNQTAELLAQYCGKGSQIGLEGRINTRNYDDPNSPGRKVYVTEVIADSITFLDSRQQTAVTPAEEVIPEAPSYTLDISSDDLPF